MIKLNNLSKKYEDLKIFEEVNYEIKNNSLTCFLGASGSGKSTLLNLIAGFDKDYKGSIKINNLDIGNLTADELCRYRFNNIGFVFQSYNLLHSYTAIENVLMGVHLKDNIGNEEKMHKAKNILIKLGLEKQINQSIETLSGGEKQRVAIARALINDPEIILADEPTGALDSQSSKAIMEILKEISKEKTVLIITHDDDIVTYADEVIEVDDYNITVQIANKNIPKNETLKNIKTKNETPKLSYNTALKLSLKNFKIHLFKFIISAFIIALGTASFIGAIASENIINNEINAFKEKNPLFNKGGVWLVGEEDPKGIFDKLNSVDDIDNVYFQYYIKNINIRYNEGIEQIDIKVPTDITRVTLAYGNIPEYGKNEIAITTKVAMNLGVTSKDILGKTLSFETENGIKELTVSGIINDKDNSDFILSTDVEKKIYIESESDKTEKISIVFDIKDFDKIGYVTSEIRNQGIDVATSAKAVESMINSFNDLINLFKFLSYLILAVGILISTIIMYKIARERYVEVGLLSALGYTKKNTKQILIKESLYFSACGMIMSIIVIKVLDIIYLKQFGYNLGLTMNSYLLLIGLNTLLTVGLSYVINMKIIKTEPAECLRTY